MAHARRKPLAGLRQMRSPLTPARIGALALLAGALCWCLFPEVDLRGPEAPAAAAETIRPVAGADRPDLQLARTDRSAAAVPPQAFCSLDEHGRPVEGARQDGIAIQVRTVRGLPVAGVRVVAAWSRHTERDGWRFHQDHGPTDDLGLLRTSVTEATVLADNLERIDVESPEFGTMTYGGDFLLTPGPVPAVVVVVPDVARLAVRVTDLNLHPLPGATAFLRSRSTLGGRGEHVLEHARLLEVGCDERGIATAIVPAGRCEVSATSEGHACEYTLQCDLPAGPCEVIVPLRAEVPAREVLVRVQLPAGISSPIALNCETRERPELPTQAHVAWVDGERRWLQHRSERPGEYLVSVSHPFRWQVRAMVEGCRRASRWVEPWEREVDLRLQADARCHVRCSVLMPDGQPASGVEFRLHHAADLGHIVPVLADEDGTQTLALMGSGPAVLSAWKRGLVPAFSGMIDLGQRSQRIELRLTSGSSLHGVLRDRSGLPVAGSVFLRRPAAALQDLARGSETRFLPVHDFDRLDSARDGRFELLGVGAGEHQVEGLPWSAAWPACRRSRVGDFVELRAGSGLEELVLVDGVVTDPDTGLPLSGVGVEVAPHVPSWVSGVVTDASGRFALALASGTGAITAHAQGRVLQVTRLLGERAGVHRLEIRLPTSRTRSLQVVDSMGRALEDVYLAVFDDDAIAFSQPVHRSLLNATSSPIGREVRTDAAGRVDLHGVPTGPLRIHAQRGSRSRTGRLARDREATRVFSLAADEGTSSVALLRW